MSRVLIVEDDLVLADLVRSLLELEGHAVDHSQTGDDGLKNLSSAPYDLVILDWHLPGLTGIEVLSQFRGSGASTPVIMLTGKDSIADKEAGFESGADDYLTKPFHMKELQARVRAQLRRTNTEAGQGIKLGNIELDTANQRASKSGRVYALKPEEFRLLEIAAKYPHIQPTYKDLLTLAWPRQGDQNEASVSETIRHLRGKLDPTAALIFSHLEPVQPPQPGPSTLSNQTSRTAAANDIYIGTVFSGKYEIIELIGDGTSGLVYRSRHIYLDNQVALKILRLNTLAHPETIPRFSREARATATLCHTNIVAVRDFGQGDQNQPYLVMELLEGASLSEILHKNGPPPLAETINIFRQVCAGLEHAHEKGLIHRDMKPSNLILTNDGDSGVLVKIVDFGLARSTLVEEGMTQITEPGVVLGSPPYMSPEQCRGETLDRRSDLYSVGCALYETLQGRPPFCGKDAVEILVKQIREAPPEVLREDAPPMVQIRLNKIISRCLAKDPSMRFQTATELGQALDQVLTEPDTPISQHEAAPAAVLEQSWLERKNSVFNWLGRRLAGQAPPAHTTQPSQPAQPTERHRPPDHPGT